MTDPRRGSLAEYIRHLELFGPECIIETAARDLSSAELAELQGMVDFQTRNHVWRRGSWIPRRTVVRSCVGCGCEIPRTRSSRASYHSDSCRRRFEKARERSRAGA